MKSYIGIGSFLKEAWCIFKTNRHIQIFSLFYVSSLLIESPKTYSENLVYSGILVAIDIVFSILMLISQVGFVLAVVNHIHDEPTGFLEIFSEARSYFWRIVILYVMLSVIVIPPLVVFSIYPNTLDSTLYYLFSIGLIFTTGLFTAVVIQGIVLNDLRPFQSVRNSVAFVSNNFLQVFAISIFIHLVLLSFKFIGVIPVWLWSIRQSMHLPLTLNMGTSILLNRVPFIKFVNIVSWYIVWPVQSIVFTLYYLRNTSGVENLTRSNISN